MKKLYLLILLITSITYAQEPFIFTWEVINPNIEMDSPVVGDYNYTIDFGDGTVLTNQTQALEHGYASPGIYTVTISGDFDRVKFEVNPSNLLTIEQWGDIQWSSMEEAFSSCTYLVINATDTPDLSQANSMRRMFNHCYALNQPLNNWDVSNVTNMEELFFMATSFNQPLDNWNVSNVTDMSGMFHSAHAFNQPIDNWNVSNVTTMALMFRYATSFNQALNNWDTSNVTSMYDLFSNANIFNQPLNNWDVSNVTDMGGMFSGAALFDHPVGNWNVSNVTNMDWMFSFTNFFNHPLNNWDVSNVTDMSSMFTLAKEFNQPLNNWNVSNVSNMNSMFSSTWDFNQPLNEWDVSNVTDMSNMFAFTQEFNHPLNDWNVSNVTAMYDMFTNASAFNQDISSWDFNTLPLSFHFNNSGLDTNNLDVLLLKFAQLGFGEKTFYGQGLNYCNTGVYNYLVNELSWTISGITLGTECEGNDISGTILLDEDANGCDTNDVAATNFLINAGNDSFNYSTFASADGSYTINVQEGGYTLNLLNIPDYFTVNPTSSAVNFTGFGNSEEINFCLTANQTVNDLNITLLPLTEARPGFEADYQLVIQNMGTQTVANAAVSLTFDNTLQTFVSAVPSATSTTATQLNFTVPTLQPFESALIDLTMTTFTPPTVNGGETASFVATVTPDANDYTPVDNIFNFDQVIVNSFDPNDKRVLQGDEIFVGQTDEYLDYIIRFQNTGTASAITVRVEDELHENLDWTTLTPVSSSHDYIVQITDGNRVEFIFNNINLPNEAADAEGSNGFIAYKIKPVADIQIGDIVSGDAAIFFDYNLPIITNEVSTEVITSLSVKQFTKSSVSIYPNPADNILNLKISERTLVEKVTIFNLQGRELLSYSSNTESINVENLSTGLYLLFIETNQGIVKLQLIKN